MDSSKQNTATWIVCAAAAACYAWLYADVFAHLAHDWTHDPNYSHGYLIAPIAIFLAWERRTSLAAAPIRPSIWGLGIVALSVVLFFVGGIGAELFLTRVAVVGTLAGAVLFVLGRTHLKLLAFPIAFLLLMIPLPAIVFNQIAFPLQLLASRVGELTLSAAGIPVLREGNIIVLANTSLEVAEACSGIRSLMTLLTLGIMYGYFADKRPMVRTAIALATVPVAIVANSLRVAGTGIAAHHFGPAAAQGFFHTFSGWLVFVVAFLLLFVIVRMVMAAVPPPAPRTAPSGAAA